MIMLGIQQIDGAIVVVALQLPLMNRSSRRAARPKKTPARNAGVFVVISFP